MYTERQKKLKSKASTWIIFGHRLGKFVLNKQCKKTKVYFSQRGDKCDDMARGQFSKITETARLSGWEFEVDKSRYCVYVTRYWNWMNSYWMFWIGCLRGARSGSSFCNFWKITFRDFTAFFSFLTRENHVFQIFVLKLICIQILLILTAWILVSVALKKWCFFWRSVYNNSLTWAQVTDQITSNQVCKMNIIIIHHHYHHHHNHNLKIWK